jgi:multidrug transporter EmrE-like cation transporter
VELEHRRPALAHLAPYLRTLEPSIEAAAWTGLAIVAASAAGAILFGGALRTARAASLRFATAFRGTLATAAGVAHLVLAWVE